MPHTLAAIGFGQLENFNFVKTKKLKLEKCIERYLKIIILLKKFYQILNSVFWLNAIYFKN